MIAGAHVKAGKPQGENTPYIKFFFYESEKSDSVTAAHAQFWFRVFPSGNFDLKDAQRFWKTSCGKYVSIVVVVAVSIT